MNNFLQTVLAGLRQIRRAWVIASIVILALVLVVVGFTSGAFSRAVAAINGKSAVAAVTVQVTSTATVPVGQDLAAASGVAATATMEPMPGMAMPDADASATATMAPMPGMDLPTTPAPAGDDAAALAMQMQDMMNSLQGMMTQLDQKSTAVALPTATPVAPSVDMQTVMTELQSINQAMGPLMVRIQADLEGNPSAEELASVRAQVNQINGRIASLIAQIQGGQPAHAGMPGMEATPSPMGQMDPNQEMMLQLEQMMAQLQQMQSGQMNGMGSIQMPQATATPGMSGMQGMSGSSASSMSMDDMMGMMDDMMAMMDNMMSMGGGSGMNMAAPTPMPGMPGMSGSGTSMPMDDMMMMMDNMMMMMDNMMNMGGGSGSGGGGMSMPDM